MPQWGLKVRHLFSVSSCRVALPRREFLFCHAHKGKQETGISPWRIVCPCVQLGKGYLRHWRIFWVNSYYNPESKECGAWERQTREGGGEREREKDQGGRGENRETETEKEGQFSNMQHNHTGQSVSSMHPWTLEKVSIVMIKPCRSFIFHLLMLQHSQSTGFLFRTSSFQADDLTSKMYSANTRQHKHVLVRKRLILNVLEWGQL